MDRIAPKVASASRWSRIWGIARYTLLEAWRNRFLILVPVLVAALFVLSLFIKQLAITESTQIQLGFLASSLRLTAVFLIALFVLQGLARDFQDKVVDIIFSLDLPRTHYVLGRFLGYCVLCAAVALCCAVPLLVLKPAGATLAWAAFLLLELCLVAAASVFCMVTFSQLLPAATFVAGFYLLARSITAIQLMSSSTLMGGDWGTKAAAHLADALSLLLPRLDAFTQTAWLVDSTGVPIAFGRALLQLLVYGVLLLSAAMFDLQRRNF
jgi:ABC-type transport system involved in multi-copper enzyme maturation permease subunit